MDGLFAPAWLDEHQRVMLVERLSAGPWVTVLVFISTFILLFTRLKRRVLQFQLTRT
jgi:hypothetical protein